MEEQNGFFLTIPAIIIQDRRLTWSERSIWAYLNYRQGENGYCWPSFQRVADDLNISRNTVIKGIRNLTNMKYIKTEQNGTGSQTNHYITSAKKVPVPIITPTTSAKAAPLQCKNDTSTSAKIAPLLVQKLHPNINTEEEHSKRKEKSNDAAANEISEKPEKSEKYRQQTQTTIQTLSKSFNANTRNIQSDGNVNITARRNEQKAALKFTYKGRPVVDMDRVRPTDDETKKELERQKLLLRVG